MLFIVLFSMVTTFSNFQATFLLISLPKYLEYSHQISPQKSGKYDLTFSTKIRVGLQKNRGDDVVDHVRHF